MGGKRYLKCVSFIVALFHILFHWLESSLQSQGSTTGELTPDPFGETPQSPPFIQVSDEPNRFTFKSVSSGLGTNESSSYFEDTSDQTSGSAEEPDTDCSGDQKTPIGMA